MNKLIIICVATLLLTGCFRNSPKEQAEDYGVCKKAGMKAVRNNMNEVFCFPYRDN